jgi:hypothetical protein
MSTDSADDLLSTRFFARIAVSAAAAADTNAYTVHDISAPFCQDQINAW